MVDNIHSAGRKCPRCKTTLMINIDLETQEQGYNFWCPQCNKAVKLEVPK